MLSKHAKGHAKSGPVDACLTGSDWRVRNGRHTAGTTVAAVVRISPLSVWAWGGNRRKPLTAWLMEKLVPQTFWGL